MRDWITWVIIRMFLFEFEYSNWKNSFFDYIRIQMHEDLWYSKSVEYFKKILWAKLYLGPFYPMKNLQQRWPELVDPE